MSIEELLAYGLTLPGAQADKPFREQRYTVLRHAENRKWFALLYTREGKAYTNLKCEPMQAQFQRQVFAGVTPAWHMDKRHWNTVALDSDVPPAEIQNMLRDSYRLTRGGNHEKP